MDSTKETLCPVCGYDVGFPAWVGKEPSDEICPCCGIQFGYDDAAGGNLELRRVIYEKWRAQWMVEGMPWKSAGTKAPPDWNAELQLASIGIDTATD